MPLPSTVKAYAKINLFLNLLGPRSDGFHDVRFVMQRLSLHDTLHLQPCPDSGLVLTCSDPLLAGPDNLIAKAYHAFYEACRLPAQGLQVHLEKNIPIQAGLGGGSSDAAAMLSALNDSHQCPLSQQALMSIGGQLGSDVPFFLGSPTAITTGRGEIITPVASLLQTPVVLVKPKHWGISTPQAFGWVRSANQYQPADFTSWETVFKSPEVPKDWRSLLQNDFEDVVFAHHPELATAKHTLLTLGAQGALLSGSGPTLLGLFPQGIPTPQVLDTTFPPDTWQVIPTEFCP